VTDHPKRFTERPGSNFTTGKTALGKKCVGNQKKNTVLSGSTSNVPSGPSATSERERACRKKSFESGNLRKSTGINEIRGRLAQ